MTTDTTMTTIAPPAYFRLWPYDAVAIPTANGPRFEWREAGRWKPVVAILVSSAGGHVVSYVTADGRVYGGDRYYSKLLTWGRVDEGPKESADEVLAQWVPRPTETVCGFYLLGVIEPGSDYITEIR